MYFLNPFTAKCSQRQILTKFANFILEHFAKQIAKCDSTGRELSFEWSHQRISSTDTKAGVILQNSTKHSGSERVKKNREENGQYNYTNQLFVFHVLGSLCILFFLPSPSCILHSFLLSCCFNRI